MSNNFILVIPARLNSTRLPRKLLINVEGKTIIERTYNCALKALGEKDKIIIATDSNEIKYHCENFGARVIMTSENCLTGTDRVAEVAEKIDVDQYINLQGDEPIFPTSELNFFIKEVSNNLLDVHTAITRIKNESDFRNFSIPKMVFTNSKKLLYSSRAAIPASKSDRFSHAYKHVCIYAFNKKHLELFHKQKQKSTFELQEDLEINRFLELDINVRCVELTRSGKAVDNINDLEIVKEYLKNQT